jgi:murein endopeptidase
MARTALPLGVLPVVLVAAAVVYAQDEPSGGSSPPPAAQQPAPPAEIEPGAEEPPRRYARIRWRRSVALGRPFAGRLLRGVRLPAEGRDFFTWDPVLKRTPNRAWRRWGTDRLLRVVLRVLRAHRAAFPGAPRVGIGDISRRRGGDFGPRFGSIGHASHQNGLDVDVYYPRLDGLEERAARVEEIDMELAQDLVDRFVAARAQYVFVGPRTPLAGPRKRVMKLVHHDDHLHVRMRPR